MSSKLTIADAVELRVPSPPQSGSRDVNLPPPRLPRLGFGVYQSPPSQCYQSCLTALRAGYRHIDSAQYYANEAEVGRAVRDADCLSPDTGEPESAESGQAEEEEEEDNDGGEGEEDEGNRRRQHQIQRQRRSQVFLTTKVLSATGSVDKTYNRCLASVEKMDPGEGGYVDLFLIHSPNCGREKREELWTALERLYADGKARSIGVSNYGAGQIQEMKSYAKVVWPPQVNQIELHPYCQQKVITAYCQKNNITIEAYSPLVRGHKSYEQTLVAVAAKYHHQHHDHHQNNNNNNNTQNHDQQTTATPPPPAPPLAAPRKTTPAQILIRYSLQKGWVPLPKSDDPARIAENAEVFDFEIDDEDMRTLDGLDRGEWGAVVQAVTNEE